jgi:hypothetical protein
MAREMSLEKARSLMPARLTVSKFLGEFVVRWRHCRNHDEHGNYSPYIQEAVDTALEEDRLDAPCCAFPDPEDDGGRSA